MVSSAPSSLSTAQAKFWRATTDAARTMLYRRAWTADKIRSRQRQVDQFMQPPRLRRRRRVPPVARTQLAPETLIHGRVGRIRAGRPGHYGLYSPAGRFHGGMLRCACQNPLFSLRNHHTAVFPLLVSAVPTPSPLLRRFKRKNNYSPLLRPQMLPHTLTNLLTSLQSGNLHASSYG